MRHIILSNHNGGSLTNCDPVAIRNAIALSVCHTDFERDSFPYGCLHLLSSHANYKSHYFRLLAQLRAERVSCNGLFDTPLPEQTVIFCVGADKIPNHRITIHDSDRAIVLRNAS